MKPTRRVVAGSVAAAGIGALFPWIKAAAQTGNNPRRIDVHHHFVPPAYAAFAKANNMSPGPVMGDRGGNGSPWDLAKDMDDMDKNGVAVAIQSITTPGFWFGNPTRSAGPGGFGPFALSSRVGRNSRTSEASGTGSSTSVCA